MFGEKKDTVARKLMCLVVISQPRVSTGVGSTIAYVKKLHVV